MKMGPTNLSLRFILQTTWFQGKRVKNEAPTTLVRRAPGLSWTSALALLQDLQALDLAVNEVTYAAAISACEKSPGRWPEALRLFQEARATAAPHVAAFSAPRKA